MAKTAAKAKVAATDNTVAKQLSPHLKPFHFQPGVSPNPRGRPKGSRNKLGEEFLAAMLADFEEHGKDVIEAVRKDEPAQYLKVVAGILPKELNVTTNAVEEMSDDELAAGIAALKSLIAAQADGEGRQEAPRHKPARPLRTLQ